jgi:DNA-binding NtrC family response regulator
MKVRDRKILVVDDDPLVLESCRRILEAEEYLVVCVPSAGDAFDNLEMGHFDLMIMDIKMPRQDGFYLLGKIEEKWPLDRFLELPVLVMTGYPTQETLRELKKRGVCHFIPKPFTPDELLAAVQKILERSETNEEKKSPGD